MTSPDDNPGSRLRQARRMRGLTAAELGRQAATVAKRVRALSESAVRNQENGTNGIPLDLADAYAEVLGVTTGWIYWGTGAPNYSINNYKVPIIGIASAKWRHQTAFFPPYKDIAVELAGFEDAKLGALEVDSRELEPLIARGSYLIVCRSDEVAVRSHDLVFVRQGRGSDKARSIRSIYMHAGSIRLTGIGAALGEEAIELVEGCGITIRFVVVGSLSPRPSRDGPNLPIETFIPKDSFRRIDKGEPIHPDDD